MNEDQRKRIQNDIDRLRQIAEGKGSQHAAWDLIFDLEALLSGQKTSLDLTPSEYSAITDQFFN